MTPVTMCTTLRMTMDASAASIVPPFPGAPVSYGSVLTSQGRGRITKQPVFLLPRPVRAGRVAIRHPKERDRGIPKNALSAHHSIEMPAFGDTFQFVLAGVFEGEA
jgi:hypothetical protein